MSKYIYFGSKIFSVYDRYSTFIIYKYVENFIKKNNLDLKLFLPFKDSNNTIDNSDKDNVSRLIFLKDINFLDQTVLFIGRLDGNAFDSGVGFEIGYLFSHNVPSILIYSGFLKLQFNDKTYYFSKLLDKACQIINIQFFNTNNYETDIINNIENINKQLLDSMQIILKSQTPTNCNDLQQSRKKDVFIDFMGGKYEWCREYQTRIAKQLDKLKITYYINEYNDEKNDEIFYCQNSNIIVTTIDSEEIVIDTAFLIGLAYGLNKKIIIYSTRKCLLFSSTGQRMYLNLMLEESSILVHSFNDLINKIMEVQNDLV